jgi:hypothetical protein
MEVLVDKVFMKNIKFDELNSLDLRSDIENNNIFGTVLVSQGYVGNRPTDAEGEYEDDTWAIDCLTEDGDCVCAYLYTSEFEYNEDCAMLKEFE